MQDKISSAKWPFRLCYVVPPLPPELLVFVSPFDLTREVSRSEMDKVMMSPMCVKERCAGVEMVDMAAASSITLPKGPVSSCLEEMKLFLVLPYRFSLVPGTRCYRGSLLSPVWLLSTLSERALSTFLRFTTLSVSSQPLLFPSVSLWDFEVFLWTCSCFFFFFKWVEFVPWCLFQRRSLRILKNFLHCYEK